MRKWIWLTYSAFLTAIIISGLGELFNKDSSIRNFYTILIAFDKRYVIFLILEILSLLLDIIAPLIIVCFIMNIDRYKKLWQILFWLRLFLGFSGHFYEWQFIKASFYQNITYGIACITIFIAPVLPSYIIHFYYAFKKPKIS